VFKAFKYYLLKSTYHSHDETNANTLMNR